MLDRQWNNISELNKMESSCEESRVPTFVRAESQTHESNISPSAKRLISTCHTDKIASCLDAAEGLSTNEQKALDLTTELLLP
jgi:hypothetical protein